MMMRRKIEVPGRVAVSSMYEKPAEDITWRMLFYEKTKEDITIALT